MLAPPPSGELAPPPRGNPGSATDTDHGARQNATELTKTQFNPNDLSVFPLLKVNWGSTFILVVDTNCSVTYHDFPSCASQFCPNNDKNSHDTKTEPRHFNPQTVPTLSAVV